MKEKFEKLSTLILILVISFVLYRKIPDLWRQIKAEGSPAIPIQLTTLKGQVFDSVERKDPFVVVFWATWCGPCEIELNRLNQLIEKKQIADTSVLAISIQEDKSLVEKTVEERNYKFAVAIDPTGEIANQYGVSGTPTVVLITRDKQISWITTGLSPLLGFRVEKFLRANY